MEVKGYITNLGKYNEGCLIGEWVTFPIDEEEEKEIFDRIGINEEYEEYFFTDWDGYNFGEYISIEEVNELAERLEDIDDNLLYAMLEAYSSDISEALDRIEDERFFYYGVDSTILEIAEQKADEELERYDIPDFIQRNFNYQSYADELENYMTQTSYGVIELF